MTTLNSRTAKMIVATFSPNFLKPTNKVNRSVNELMKYGKTTTGESSRRSKSIWTSEVVSKCKSLGMVIEFGNDAPRGGAGGEYVRLVADKRKNREIHRVQGAVKYLSKLGDRVNQIRLTVLAIDEYERQTVINNHADKLFPTCFELRLFNLSGTSQEKHEQRMVDQKVLNQVAKIYFKENYYPIMDELVKRMAMWHKENKLQLVA